MSIKISKKFMIEAHKFPLSPDELATVQRIRDRLDGKSSPESSEKKKSSTKSASRRTPRKLDFEVREEKERNPIPRFIKHYKNEESRKRSKRREGLPTHTSISRYDSRNLANKAKAVTHARRIEDISAGVIKTKNDSKLDSSPKNNIRSFKEGKTFEEFMIEARRQSPKPTVLPKSRERDIGKHDDWKDKPSTEWGDRPEAGKKLKRRAQAVVGTRRRQDKETGVYEEFNELDEKFVAISHDKARRMKNRASKLNQQSFNTRHTDPEKSKTLSGKKSLIDVIHRDMYSRRLKTIHSTGERNPEYDNLVYKTQVDNVKGKEKANKQKRK